MGDDEKLFISLIFTYETEDNEPFTQNIQNNEVSHWELISSSNYSSK